MPAPLVKRAGRLVLIAVIATAVIVGGWLGLSRWMLARTSSSHDEIFQRIPPQAEAAMRLAAEAPPDLRPFFVVEIEVEERVAAGVRALESNWDDRYVVMLLEMLRVRRNAQSRGAVYALLNRATDAELGADTRAWWTWVWSTDPGMHEQYGTYKSLMYGLLDPSFSRYFADDRPATIRLDEIRWGGVRRDGIPPLDEPDMIDADEADYLDDTNVVFGIQVNGDARAYPKRILAWHEMFKDTVGGEPVTGVYCTLCGSMILYRSSYDGVRHELGTSGFLYRSNKLMYDQETYSLWSTMRGEPVVGPLVGRGIALEPLSVVTTTWGQWRRQHPETTVLSLDTGHRRDYGEGVAYQRYFATDELMFGVPALDTRLANKAEVLALRFAGDPERPLAIAAEFLAANPVLHETLGDVAFVVLTDDAGGNRVYETGDRRFARLGAEGTVTDADGGAWRVEEAALVHGDGTRLRRLPAHRAFWFGWYAAHPGTRLIR